MTEKQKNITPKRPLKDSFSVIVEGGCEAWYLNMLKRHEKSVQISINPEIPQKKHLSDSFELVKEKAKDYTKVFWIVDLDVIIKETKEAKKGKKTRMNEFLEYQTALKKDYTNVMVIVNNPCFEIWFLLHFEQNNVTFSDYKSLKKVFIRYLPDYEKKEKYYVRTNPDIWIRLKNELQTAYENAKKLGYFDENNTAKALAEMWLLFEETAFKGLVEVK